MFFDVIVRKPTMREVCTCPLLFRLVDLQLDSYQALVDKLGLHDHSLPLSV